MGEAVLTAAGRSRPFLLLLALATTVVAALSYASNTGNEAADLLLPLSVVGVVAVLGHVWMRVRLPSADQTLYCVTLVLMGLGLVMIARLDPPRFPKQIAWTGAAIVALVGTATLVRRPEKLGAYQYVCGASAVVLVLLPTILHMVTRGRGDVTADVINGARLWIQFGTFFSLQPAEFAKILIAIFLAGYLTEKGDVLADWPYRLWRMAVPPLRHAGPLLVVWLASLGLLAAQRDLGCALLVFCLFLEMLYSATGRPGYPAVGLVLFAIGAAVAIHLGAGGFLGHVQTRIDAWVNPWADPNHGGYQMLQSLYALGQGDVLGTGIGRGMPTAIPEVSTDFIFSAIGEELGLVGGCAVLFCYALIVVRGFVASGRARDDFSALLGAGLTAGLVTQAAIIVCGVTKFLPMTGITLPFVSYGGSSIVASGIAVGLLTRISAEPAAIPRAAGARPRTRPLAWFHLAAFLVLSVWLGYWQVARGPSLNVDSRNPRMVELNRKVPRGRIIDRNGAVLASQDPDTGQRVYPTGRIAAPVVGYRDETFGSAGIEGSAGGWLLGLHQPDGTLRDLASQLLTAARPFPKRGNDVQLTLDLGLQKRAYELLGDRRGAIAALNPRTGEVLCLASRPTFDPAHLAEAMSGSAGASGELMNRATQGLYPPGSAFKILVAAAALDAGVVTPSFEATCKGEEIIRHDRIRCVKRSGHGTIRLDAGLINSCNICFAHVGEQFLDKLGTSAGERTFVGYCEAFGLDAIPPVGLSVERSRVPTGSEMTEAMVLECSFGQGGLMVTPLHMALIAGAIGRGGQVMVPQVIERVISPEGDVAYRMDPKLWRQAVRPESARIVAGYMRRVVSEGTGGNAALDDVAVAGKTGTAETGRGEPHAWFVCFAPADDPEIALAVIVEHGGGGGAVAAPIARKVLETYFARR